jgi:hypothetical protein
LTITDWFTEQRELSSLRWRQLPGATTAQLHSPTFNDLDSKADESHPALVIVAAFAASTGRLPLRTWVLSPKANRATAPAMWTVVKGATASAKRMAPSGAFFFKIPTVD